MMVMMNSTLKFWAPPANQPIPWVAIPFNPLFSSLPINHILVIWTCLTLARQVLLTSSSLTLLTECCEILVSLLFPMSWTHCYIPCLPNYLLPVLSAPMPYVCGIDKTDLEDAMSEISNECVVVDLDLGTLKMGEATPKLPLLPSKRRQKLERELKASAGEIYKDARDGWIETVNRMDDAFYVAATPEDITEKDGEDGERERGDWDSVQEAFFRFYIALLKDYRRFLLFPKEDAPMMAGFESKPFVQSQPKEFQPFLKQLCATQQFDAFITKRLYKPGEEDVTFFDESIDAKLNRYKMKLKKIETPFLQSAKVQRKLKTVVAPEPSKEGLSGEVQYTYATFPSELDPALLGTPKPLPTVIAEENRKRLSRARLRISSSTPSISIPRRGSVSDPPLDGSSNTTASASSATFTVFFMAYTAVVGKDLKELEDGGDNAFDTAERKSVLFNRLSSADEDELRGAVGVQTTVSETGSEAYESAAEEEITGTVEAMSTNESTDSSKGSETASKRRSSKIKSIKEEMLEEARATAKAQLDLAFEVLLMMRRRDVMPESFAYQCLIDACGRCGDTNRVCELLGMMHEDGVVADSVVYSCLVKAFSVDTHKKKNSDLPSFANGYSGAVDWNKMRSGSVMGPPASPARSTTSSVAKGGNAAAPSTPQAKLMSFFKTPSLSASFASNQPAKAPEYHLTSKISRHIDLGNSLLELLYQDIYVDTSRGMCNVCEKKLEESDVCKGWAMGESHEYRVTCPKCEGKGIVRFSIFSTGEGWVDSGILGQEGKLFCEYLSPWVLKKELMSIMSESISTLLDPAFPSRSTQKATIYWNLVVSFKREKLPFTWMFQGSFGNSLITPSPEDVDTFDRG